MELQIPRVIRGSIDGTSTELQIQREFCRTPMNERVPERVIFFEENVDYYSYRKFHRWNFMELCNGCEHPKVP